MFTRLMRLHVASLVVLGLASVWSVTLAPNASGLPVFLFGLWLSVKGYRRSRTLARVFEGR